jgi:hypothetical protein
MSEHAGGEMVKVTLRGLRSDTPFDNRLRHPLKAALRQLRLRCATVESVPHCAGRGLRSAPSRQL